MATEIISTEVGHFEIQIFPRTKTLGSVIEVKIATPSGYVHRDSYGGSNPVEFAIEWISEIGIDREERLIDTAMDNQIWEWGRNNDLPLAESVHTMKELA